MNQPARWMGDPDCGHLVRDPFQTHYCTYIRVPKLLTLQNPQTDHPDERLALLALQAIELWLKVVANDVSAVFLAVEQGGRRGYEPTKLLHRICEIAGVLDQHVDLARSVLVHDLEFRIPMADQGDRLLSDQLERLRRGAP